jgi:cell division protein FtsB
LGGNGAKAGAVPPSQGRLDARLRNGVGYYCQLAEESDLSYLRQISPMQILLLLVLTVALYFTAAFGAQLIANQRIDQQVASISAEIGRLRADNQRLTARVADGRSDAYVEREARDRLGLVRAGDVGVVVVNAPAPAAPPPPPPAAPRPHWAQWAGRLGIQA